MALYGVFLAFFHIQQTQRNIILLELFCVQLKSKISSGCSTFSTCELLTLSVVWWFIRAFSLLAAGNDVEPYGKCAVKPKLGAKSGSKAPQSCHGFSELCCWLQVKFFIPYIQGFSWLRMGLWGVTMHDSIVGPHRVNATSMRYLI